MTVDPKSTPLNTKQFLFVIYSDMLAQATQAQYKHYNSDLQNYPELPIILDLNFRQRWQTLRTMSNVNV